MKGTWRVIQSNISWIFHLNSIAKQSKNSFTSEREEDACALLEPFPSRLMGKELETSLSSVELLWRRHMHNSIQKLNSSHWDTSPPGKILIKWFCHHQKWIILSMTFRNIFFICKCFLYSSPRRIKCDAMGVVCHIFLRYFAVLK
jgi:hypothetical protein